jgi:uncharacterized protein
MPDESPERSLLEASETGAVEKARSIVEDTAHPVDLNCRNESEDTPLILAARNGHDELVRFLMEKGADLNAINQSGEDALIAASERQGNTSVLESLLDAGAVINRQNDLGRTALIEAASIGDLENVSVLLQRDPDPEVVSGEEETALTFAVVNEYPGVVQALIEAGAAVNSKDTKGWTPLTYAVHSGNPEVVRLLVNAEADVNHADMNGDTILMHAVRSRNVNVVGEVLKKASNVKDRNDYGMTALDYSEQNRTEEISKLLRVA